LQRVARLAIVACLALALPAGWDGPRAQDASPADAKGSRLQGTAAINRRDRVVGAAVIVRCPDDPGRIYLTSTDAGGVFAVDGLPNGDYEVLLERSGFQTVVKEQVRVRFPFRAVVEVVMPPAEQPAARVRTPADASVGEGTITLRGRMRQRDADPVGEVRVRLVHPTGKRDPRYAESDQDGNFRVDDLPAGDWILVVNAVGYLPLRVQLDLGRDSQLDIGLVRQPADYVPSPLELMPPEQPAPPPGFLRGSGAS